MVVPRYDAAGRRVNGGMVVMIATVLLVAALAWWARRFVGGEDEHEPDPTDAMQVLGGWISVVPPVA